MLKLNVQFGNVLNNICGCMTVTKYASKPHQLRQHQIAEVLRRAVGNRGFVTLEFGFRALPEHEARRADVAFVTADRIRAAVGAAEFYGAPDLVIEVLSPSNSAAEMDDKEKLCFANGCREFWLVNDERKTVRVTPARSPVRWCGAGQTIRSETLEASVAVDDLFGGLGS